jgi:hypothetical protein
METKQWKLHIENYRREFREKYGDAYMSQSEKYKDTLVTIYGIKSYGNIIYVGQTTNFKNRKCSHTKRINELGVPLYEYMENNPFEFVILKTCSYEDRIVEENKMIRYYLKKNFLYNKSYKK